MNKSSVSLAIATAALFVFTLTIVVIADNGIVRILGAAACLCALIGGGWFYALLRQIDVRREQDEQNIHINRVLDVLQRKRHDWMNGIQVLYGYSKLKKHDRVLENIESLSERLKQESNISKIGDPKLEWFLHEYASKALKFDFEIDLHERMNLIEIEVDRQLVYEAVSRTADMIEQAAQFSEQEDSHYFTLNMDTLKDKVCINCHYDGVYEQKTVRMECERLLSDLLKREPNVQMAHHLSPDHLFIEIKLPYRT